MIFHLSNIDVREVSLVDHGAIDHDFTDHKSGAKARWFADTFKNRINEAKISVDALAEKSGIDSKELEAISTGSKSAKAPQLSKIAEALGLKSDPKNKEADDMDEKKIKAMLEALLSPLTKALDAVKEDVKKVVDERKAEADKAAAAAKTAKDKADEDAKSALPPADAKELTERLTKAEATVKELGDQLESAAKQIVARFEEVEKTQGAGRSQKIAGGDEDEKKVKWPSFAKLANR